MERLEKNYGGGFGRGEFLKEIHNNSIELRCLFFVVCPWLQRAPSGISGSYGNCDACKKS